MNSRLAHTLEPAIYRGHPSLVSRAVQKLTSTMSWFADILVPARVCHRIGHHVPGDEVFGYELWDLDQRFPGFYVGHACGKCGELLRWSTG